MKLLVTGATGFLGWRTTVLMREAGHEVTATTRPGGAQRAAARGLDAVLLFGDIDGPIKGIVIGIPLMAAVGLWDDIRGMRPLVKLVLILAIC
ncbi:MAG: NAD-dependent epimerase/dehydratase family protein, partial [Solirubrobacterales bacterium]